MSSSAHTTSPEAPPAALVDADVARALAEDIGTGDVTAALLPDQADSAYLLCKQDAVIAGRPWFDATHRALDSQVRIDWQVHEGQHVAAGTVLAILHGRSRSPGQRRAHLAQFHADALCYRDHHCCVCRCGSRHRHAHPGHPQTLPGLRAAQKYAVRCGGGDNHRIGLFDTVMLKENHIRAAGSLSAAVHAARAQQPQLPLVVEVETLEQLREALQVGCTRILIDDFDPAMRREAVRIVAALPHEQRIPLEVSGSVDLAGIAAIANDGVDCISIGGLTKHVQAVDLSLKLGPPPH